MSDEKFIQQILHKGELAKQKVEKELSDVSEAQLNWKPTADQWSVGECLDHLIVSDRLFFDDLKKVINGTYTMTIYQKYSPLTSFWGKIFKEQLQETVSRKLNAPQKMAPSSSDKPGNFVELYLSNLDTFLILIAGCKQIDLDKTILTSPTLKFVTFSLRDAFEFLITHEHRHINQAIRVKNEFKIPL
jgi:hypothetical protein